jgi:hypothetical protein
LNVFLFLIFFFRESGVLCPNLLEWHGILYFPFGGKGEKLERGGGGGRGEEKKGKKNERKKGINNNVRFSFLFPKIL